MKDDAKILHSRSRLEEVPIDGTTFDFGKFCAAVKKDGRFGLVPRHSTATLV
jgi:hypothetical protein